MIQVQSVQEQEEGIYEITKTCTLTIGTLKEWTQVGNEGQGVEGIVNWNWKHLSKVSGRAKSFRFVEPVVWSFPYWRYLALLTWINDIFIIFERLELTRTIRMQSMSSIQFDPTQEFELIERIGKGYVQKLTFFSYFHLHLPLSIDLNDERRLRWDLNAFGSRFSFVSLFANYAVTPLSFEVNSVKYGRLNIKRPKNFSRSRNYNLELPWMKFIEKSPFSRSVYHLGLSDIMVIVITMAIYGFVFDGNCSISLNSIFWRVTLFFFSFRDLIFPPNLISNYFS